MSDYIITGNELYHYGVKGMRWGVRRATKQLSNATTKEDKAKAVSKLKIHKTKATSEIAKLQAKNVKLEKKREKQILTTDQKAAKLRQKGTAKRNKSYRLLMSKSRRAKLRYKADKLNAKADSLYAQSQRTKAKIEANKTMMQMFEKGINDIDKAMVSRGKRYMSIESSMNKFNRDTTAIDKKYEQKWLAAKTEEERIKIEREHFDKVNKR